MSNAIPIIIEHHEPEHGKSRVAAYCRVSSSSDEQLHSYYAQVDYYTRMFSDSEKYILVGIYGDAGVSGTQAAKRAGFMQMIEDCRSGQIDCIWTKSVSRFGRNTVDTLIYTRELRAAGIDVFFEKENIHTIDPAGEMLLTLVAAFAESEAESISENIKWGKRRKYEQGLFDAVSVCHMTGYRQKNGVITVNEEEAEIVRRIYREFLDCYTYIEIANHLNQDGIPTRLGAKEWSNTQIRNILKNEICRRLSVSKNICVRPDTAYSYPKHRAGHTVLFGRLFSANC